jgi:hypothetical protein
MVTSGFHFERSQLIFEWVFGLEGAGMALGGGYPPDGASGTNGVKRSQERKQRSPLLEHSLEDFGGNRSSSSCDELSNNGSSAEDLSREARTSRARTPGSQGFVMHYLRASDEGIDPDVIQVGAHFVTVCRESKRMYSYMMRDWSALDIPRSCLVSLSALVALPSVPRSDGRLMPHVGRAQPSHVLLLEGQKR